MKRSFLESTRSFARSEIRAFLGSPCPRVQAPSTLDYLILDFTYSFLMLHWVVLCGLSVPDLVSLNYEPCVIP
jgi:hypothetical protein